MQTQMLTSGLKACRLPAQHSPCRRRLVVQAATALPAQYKNVAPVGDRVFVKVDSNEATSTGGILLPTTAQTKPTQGQIVGLGDVKAVKQGDKVVYSKYAGTELELTGEEHVLLKEDDIIGVLNSDKVAEMKPLGDRVFIEVAESESASAGGVLLAGSTAEQPTMGKVVAVGSGKVDDKGEVKKPNVSVGSLVLYSKYSGTEFEGENDKKYIVVREMDILATLS